MRFLVQWWLRVPAGRSTTHTLACDFLFTFFVWKADDCVGVRDVERFADECHAEWRVKTFEKSRAGVGHAVAVGVAQQADAIRARHAGARLFHHHLHDLALYALALAG